MKRFYSLVSIMLFVLTISFANINTVKALETEEIENQEEIVEEQETEKEEEQEVETYSSVVEEDDEEEVKPGQVTGDKTAEVVTGDGEDGRSADVTITVKGEGYNEVSTDKKEIVLVLDASGSMKNTLGGTSKMASLKAAAKELIKSLLSNGNKDLTKVGIVYYASNVDANDYCELSNDEETLIRCIDRKSADGGTNVQAGVKKATELFEDETASRTIILLSDGIPTYYNDENGNLHGDGNSDNYEYTSFHEDTDYVYDRWGNLKSYTRIYYLDSEKTQVVKTCKATVNFPYDDYDCTTEEEYKPSTKAKDAIKDFKKTGTVYTIGFGNVGENAQKFLEEMASSKDNYFSAGSIEGLKDAFKAIERQIDLIASDVKVIDTVPDTFEVDKDYLNEKYSSKETLEDGSTTYKDKDGNDVLNVKENKDGTTTLTWYIGELKASAINNLTFRIKAVNPYYGSMYTNKRATVSGVASNGNPFYTETKNIEFDLPLPSVVIPSVTDDDEYDVNQGETLNGNIRDNDYNGKLSQDGFEVVDQIIVVDGVSKGTLNVANDGSGRFTYLAPEDFYGDVNFTYYIKTIATKNGKTYEVISNVSNVTITVKRIPTDYVIHHYIKGTTEKVADDETGTGYVNEKATGRAILDLENYTLVDNVYIKTITLQRKGNVIIFYYELKEAANVTVHHYIKGTTKNVAEDDILTGKVTEGFKAYAHQDLDIYKLADGEPSFVEGTFTLEGQKVIFYYELKEAANVTVHHYIKGTTTKVAEDDILTGKVTEGFKAYAHQDLDIYKLADGEPSFVEGTFTLEEQKVIFYYEPVMGKLTVKYVDENGKNLTDEIVSEDQIKKAYKTSAKSFENYELVKVIGNEEGYYDVNDTEVVYVYRFIDKDIPNTGITNNYALDVIFTVSLISLLGYAILKVKENN